MDWGISVLFGAVWHYEAVGRYDDCIDKPSLMNREASAYLVWSACKIRSTNWKVTHNQWRIGSFEKLFLPQNLCSNHNLKQISQIIFLDAWHSGEDEVSAMILQLDFPSHLSPLKTLLCQNIHIINLLAFTEARIAVAATIAEYSSLSHWGSDYRLSIIKHGKWLWIQHCQQKSCFRATAAVF